MKQTPFASCWKALFAVAAVASAAFTGTALASDKPVADRLRGLAEPIVAKKPFRIAVSVVHMQDDFWKGIAYGIADEAKRSNVEVVQVAVAGAYGNVREQFAQLANFQAKGVDVVVVGAAAYDGYNAELKKLKDAGITVVAAGVPVNSPNVDFGVAQDNRDIGVAQAKKVCSDAAGKPVQAIVLQGPAGAEWAKQKYDGFVQTAARDCPNVKVVSGAVGKSLNMERGLSETVDLLTRTPEAKYVVTPVVSMGLGSVQALRQQNRKDVKVVSTSVVAEVGPMLKDGRVFALVSEPGVLMGRMVVQNAIRQREKLPMLNMTKYPDAPYPAYMVPSDVIDASNAGTYDFSVYDLPPKDWSIKAFQ